MTKITSCAFAILEVFESRLAAQEWTPKIDLRLTHELVKALW